MCRKLGFFFVAFGFSACVLTWAALADDKPAYDRRADVIYGRKFGTALTMDVLTPKVSPNKAAIVWVISGGWISGHESIDPGDVDELLKRGYTIFAVVHGSQPKFTIPEILEDMHRAVRFIRYHAKDYSIDPNRIGITGGSAGGHLSLMQGMAGNGGDKNAKDPIDQTSSRVQAVACFMPPTDFLNYGKPGEIALGCGILAGEKAAFDFHELDPARGYFVPVTDVGKILEIGRQISPITHVSADDPPTLIIHGDADHIVPIQQTESILERLKSAGVETKLVVKKGARHGWRHSSKDMSIIADWFDAHLTAPKKEEASSEE
jgi:acetyl esterase/lipase